MTWRSRHDGGRTAHDHTRPRREPLPLRGAERCARTAAGSTSAGDACRAIYPVRCHRRFTHGAASRGGAAGGRPPPPPPHPMRVPGCCHARSAGLYCSTRAGGTSRRSGGAPNPAAPAGSDASHCAHPPPPRSADRPSSSVRSGIGPRPRAQLCEARLRCGPCGDGTPPSPTPAGRQPRVRYATASTTSAPHTRHRRRTRLEKDKYSVRGLRPSCRPDSTHNTTTPCGAADICDNVARHATIVFRRHEHAL